MRQLGQQECNAAGGGNQDGVHHGHHHGKVEHRVKSDREELKSSESFAGVNNWFVPISGSSAEDRLERKWNEIFQKYPRIRHDRVKDSILPSR